LKTLPHKCLYKTAIENYSKPVISRDTVILLQGGGNFGDLWRRHTDFCLRIINDFPENKIIILPQTVFYRDEKTLLDDAAIMNSHRGLTICARDGLSHELLLEHFHAAKILLLPDMAFCISPLSLEKKSRDARKSVLFLKRGDIELETYNFEHYLKDRTGIEEHDWPGMQKKLLIFHLLVLLKKLGDIFKGSRLAGSLTRRLVDRYAVHVFMPGLIKRGIAFLGTYEYIFTTRLHGAILGILLDKPMTFFDNAYGKNSSFYNTWLKGTQGIIFIEKEA